MKNFKARITGLTPWIHAVEVFFQAENIIQAGKLIMEEFAANGIEPGNIVQLIETDPRHDC